MGHLPHRNNPRHPSPTNASYDMAYIDELNIWNGYDEPILTSDVSEIMEYVEYLIDESPLRLCGNRWTAEFFGGKRALGRCQYSHFADNVQEGKIQLSKPWFVDIGMETMLEHSAVGRERLEDTIRHEIAHAISVERHGVEKGRGHNWRWKNAARQVHAKPERTAHGVPEQLVAHYKRQCSNCGTVYKWLFRYAERRKTYVCNRCNAPQEERRIEVVSNDQRIV